HRALPLSLEAPSLRNDFVAARVHARDAQRVLVRLAAAGGEHRLREAARPDLGEQPRQLGPPRLAGRRCELARLLGLLVARLHDAEERPNFEATTILAAQSRLTKRVQLGALVEGVTYRHPAVIANIAATHDHVSNGRAVCGIGAAWNQTEHNAYGIYLGTPGE